MPFNPTLPADDSEILSAELRNQFNGLKELYDGLDTRLTALENQVGGLLSLVLTDTAHNPVGFPNSAIAFSDPPVTSDLTQLQENLNALKNFLARTD